MGKNIWCVCGLIISFAFSQLASILKCQKSKHFCYYCFNMVYAVKKMRGSATYKCKFKEEWLKQYPISRSGSNPFTFYCIPYQKSESCSHQGLSDVTKYCKGLTHVSFAKAIKNNWSMTTFEADNDEGVNFMVHHNLSFLTAEHFS